MCEFLDKTFHQAMIIFNEYNNAISNPTQKKEFVIYQLNNDRKFVKYLSSPKYYYFHLETSSSSILAEVEEIRDQSSSEGQFRIALGRYLNHLISLPEYWNDFIIRGVYHTYPKHSVLTSS